MRIGISEEEDGGGHRGWWWERGEGADAGDGGHWWSLRGAAVVVLVAIVREGWLGSWVGGRRRRFKEGLTMTMTLTDDEMGLALLSEEGGEE